MNMSLQNLFCRRLVREKKIINYFGRTPPILVKYQYEKEEYDSSRSNRRQYIGGSAAVLGSVLVITAKEKTKNDQNDEIKMLSNNEGRPGQAQEVEAGAKKPGLPTFTAEEVSAHDSKASFWVTYKHGVYDVTAFLPAHPGGEQIYNAAGLSIEPFWNVYGMHKTVEVFALLETFRIGNLHDDDVVDHSDAELWVQEPRRDRRLVVKTAKPFNAETPPGLQVEHFDTPNELFYVRQHMPVPELDAETHKLRIDIKLCGDGDGGGAGCEARRHVLSLGELAQFPQVSVRAALMCAGNRRTEMNNVRPVKGLDWVGGAVSNAVWTGVRLRDVLLHCGLQEVDTTGLHVIFEGADIDATGVNFSTSIPLDMAMDPSADVLLVTRMNGAELPPDHGYPLRALVPGAPAVRSVKWLESITISKDQSPSHWHQKDYRSFNPSKTWETADFSTAPPVYSLPVTSFICEPCDGATLTVDDGQVLLRGYAYSGGGAKILRVDVSVDRGRSWSEAELRADSAPARRHYSWALWTLRLPPPPADAARGQMEIWVKATDSNFNTQPENFDDIWNIRGILSNAYHKITVHLKNK